MIDQQDLAAMDDSILKSTLEGWGITVWEIESQMRNRFQSDRDKEAEHIVSEEYLYSSGISVADIPGTLQRNKRRAQILRQDEAFLERSIKMLCEDCTADEFCHTHDHDL